jgi:uncharacterized membrane protein
MRAPRPGQRSREVVAVAAVVASGLVAGVFFAVAVSVVPALRALPLDEYRAVHRLLGRGYHPTMPIVVTGAVLADVVMVGAARHSAARQVYAGATVCLLGVQAVSHLGNERLNRVVRAGGPGASPQASVDVRRPWRRWHLLRTSLACTAFGLNGVGAVLSR